MTEPWERQEGESAKAFEAFVLFRDMGRRRSIQAASREYHRNDQGAGNGPAKGRVQDASGRIKTWAKQWNWIDRAKAFDSHRDKQLRVEQAEAIREMAERQADDGKKIQGIAKLRLAKTVEKVSANPDAIEQEIRTAMDAVSIHEKGVKIERTARGAPTEIVETQDEQDQTDNEGDYSLEDATVEELRLFRDNLQWRREFLSRLIERRKAKRKGGESPNDQPNK